LQASKGKIKLSNTTFRSQIGGVVEKICPIEGYWLYLPGAGGGCMGTTIYIYINAEGVDGANVLECDFIDADHV